MRAYGENIKRGSLGLCHPFFTHLIQSLGFGIHLNHYLAFTFFKTMLIRHVAAENSQFSTIGTTHTVLSIVIQLSSLLVRASNICLHVTSQLSFCFHCYGPSYNTAFFLSWDIPALGARPLTILPRSWLLCMHRPIPSFESLRNEHHCPFPFCP